MWQEIFSFNLPRTAALILVDAIPILFATFFILSLVRKRPNGSLLCLAAVGAFAASKLHATTSQEFPIRIYGYGLMLVIGFLLAAQLAKFLARRCGYDGDVFVNACLIALVTGVIGARLSHVLESLADANSHEFARNGRAPWDNFLAMLNVSSGGLTFYGGFLLATPVLIGYALWKKIPLLRGMDIIAPCLMLGLGFGRIGCYMNGCCYGEECSLPWGAAFPYGSNAFVEQYTKGEIPLLPPGVTEGFGVPRELTDDTHPIPREVAEPGHTVRVLDPALPRLLSKDEIHQKKLDALAERVRANPVQPTEIYSAFNAFFIAAVLLAYFSLPPASGRVFALMLILKGLSRYTLEMIRVEPPVLGNLSFSMVLSIGLVAAGLLMWYACGRRARSTPTAIANPRVPATA